MNRDNSKRLGLLLSGLLFAPGARLAAQAPEEYHRRADAALQAFLLEYWDAGASYLRANVPDDGRSTGYWTFAQGFDALLDGVERTGGQRYAGLIETFYEAQASRGWRVGWYDDECWMALALIRAHDLTGEDRYLDAAKVLFDDIREAWDVTCCGGAPGGIWWDRNRSQKATASNAGPSILAARLFERTGIGDLLDFSRQVYDFWYANMVDHARNHVLDHIETDGTKVDWQFTYNEGLLIGAGTELYRLTGERRFLTETVGIATFLLSHETVTSAYGPVLSDGSNGSCGGDCHAFKGPAYRYLLLFFRVTGCALCRGALKGSADAIWNLARNPAYDLFSIDWKGPIMESFSEAQSAAAVMALNLYPALEGPYPGNGAPSDQHEAEDATIRGVGLGAEGGGFTGWGYAAGWREGGSVTFVVPVPAAGPRNLTFRYAAGAGPATRRLLVDGAGAGSVAFPGTAGWTEYATVTVRRDLRAGTSRISLVLDGAGAAVEIRLDHLLVEPIEPEFRRGDANADGVTDLSDAIGILAFLFTGGAAPPCGKAGDFTDDGTLDISDGVALLSFLFLGGRAPPEPFPGCGGDPTGDGLTCEGFPPCR